MKNEHVSLLTALQKEGLAEGPLRDREVLVGRKPMAKRWPDEQEPHRRAHRMRGPIPKKTCRKMRDKLKERFHAGRVQNLEKFIQQTLNPLLHGWMNYFRLSETKGFAEELDGWIRRRLRCILWRQWKRAATRFKRLVARGLEPARAHASASKVLAVWFRGLGNQ